MRRKKIKEKVRADETETGLWFKKSLNFEEQFLEREKLSLRGREREKKRKGERRKKTFLSTSSSNMTSVGLLLLENLLLNPLLFTHTWNTCLVLRTKNFFFPEIVEKLPVPGNDLNELSLSFPAFSLSLSFSAPLSRQIKH